MNTIEIVDYRPEHQSYFESLNRAWIELYFEMESKDLKILTEPEEMLIAPGGAILMALYDKQIAGTVALLKVDDETFEFTKMAVDPNFRRKGIAEELSYASFKKAKRLGAKTIILYSNSVLKPALSLYEKLGFRHVPVTYSGYHRSDVKMEIGIDDAIRAANNYYMSLTEK